MVRNNVICCICYLVDLASHNFAFKHNRSLSCIAPAGNAEPHAWCLSSPYQIDVMLMVQAATAVAFKRSTVLHNSDIITGHRPALFYYTCSTNADIKGHFTVMIVFLQHYFLLCDMFVETM